MVKCWWCKVNDAEPGDTLCVRCWGCKTAGLDIEECLEDWEDDEEDAKDRLVLSMRGLFLEHRDLQPRHELDHRAKATLDRNRILCYLITHGRDHIARLFSNKAGAG